MAAIDTAIMAIATPEIGITAAVGMPTVAAVLTGVITTAVPDTVITMAGTRAPATTVIAMEELIIAGNTAEEGIAAGVDFAAVGFVLTSATADGHAEDTVSHSKAADIAVDGPMEEAMLGDLTAEDIAVEATVGTADTDNAAA
jgi:hypothetical protein